MRGLGRPDLQGGLGEALVAVALLGGYDGVALGVLIIDQKRVVVPKHEPTKKLTLLLLMCTTF